MNSNNFIVDFLMENLSIENTIKFFILYFFVVWISILVWVIRDITNRTENVFLQLFSVLIILIMTPLGIFIYLLIRPGKTLFEKYYEEVETNLDCLSNEVKERIWEDNLEKINCFNCWAEVEKDFKYCPECRVKLVKKCSSCSKELDPSWKVCPYCGEDKKNKKKKEA